MLRARVHDTGLTIEGDVFGPDVDKRYMTVEQAQQLAIDILAQHPLEAASKDVITRWKEVASASLKDDNPSIRRLARWVVGLVDGFEDALTQLAAHSVVEELQAESEDASKCKPAEPEPMNPETLEQLVEKQLPKQPLFLKRCQELGEMGVELARATNAGEAKFEVGYAEFDVEVAVRLKSKVDLAKAVQQLSKSSEGRSSAGLGVLELVEESKFRPGMCQAMVRYLHKNGVWPREGDRLIPTSEGRDGIEIVRLALTGGTGVPESDRHVEAWFLNPAAKTVSLPPGSRWDVNVEIASETTRVEKPAYLRVTKADEELAPKALVDWVRSEKRWDRMTSKREYDDMRLAYIQTFGAEAWKTMFDRTVEANGLEPLIFNLEGTRDGEV